ncbi:hypothetical protein CW740_03720 [Kangiella profundi]|uniref:Uncharacterized protein n=1 Tax=Kangiella profundi TaxID=1561924 RepID=A0A2K9APQ9_9GAMM|nr:hypothetical protein [Kangiella profundi]AUD78403.1 hypothetical protein CW740_03720 [Kangiella profundi]GGF07646.1 hypothetical protein GCM10011356_21440 [Kangiella profundi]
MAPLIIAALYGLMFLLIKLVTSFEFSNETRLIINIVGGISALVLPIIIYSIIDFKLTQRSINLVGQSWCKEQNVELKKVEMHKNHFALICLQDNKKIRKKFRVRFIPTTWFVKSVEWLEK